MTKKEILAKLPVEVDITQEMIDEAQPNLYNCNNCLGALTLKSGFPDCDATWMAYTGSLNWEVIVTTKEGVNMVLQKEPIRVTLILK